MDATMIYPGTFSPPTYGHLAIARRAAELCPELTVICSVNPDKAALFTPDECRELWSGYGLPGNMRVTTLPGFLACPRSKRLVMVRGIRGESDAEDEKRVMLMNRREYGVKEYLYLWSDCEFERVSSSAAREAAADLDLRALSTLVSPKAANALLRKRLCADRVAIVAGKPGTGKSAFLRFVSARDPETAVIEADRLNDALRPLINGAYPGEDLISLALNREDDLIALIGDRWLELMALELRLAYGKKRILIEIPYALEANKRSYRFFGDDILYFSEPDGSVLAERVIGRGTPELLPFIGKIPGVKEAERTAREERLSFRTIETGRTPADLEAAVDRFLREEERREP